MKRLVVTTAVAVIGLTACGRDEPDMSQGARDALNPLVAQIRQAAETRQADRLVVLLSELRARADGLVGQGEMSRARAVEVHAAAANVAAQVPLITTTTTTTAPPPAVVISTGGDDDDRGKKKKRDRDDDD